MNKNSQNKTVYDLEERTFLFGRKVRLILKKLDNQSLIEDDIKHLFRSSGSVGANYIEANESLSKKDFLHRIKICRTESQESAFWSRMLIETVENEEINDLKSIHQ